MISKILISAAISTSVFLASVGPAWAPPPVPCTDAITFTENTSFAFGDLASDVDFSGTVVIDASTGNKTVTGGVIDFGGSHATGEWQIVADGGCVVIISLPGSITVSGGSGSTTVRNFTIDVTSPLTMPNSGKKVINIGATLDVDANQTAAAYTGSYTFSVIYQ